MGQSLVSAYLHITFSTKHREPLLRDRDRREDLFGYMTGVCKELKGPSIRINGVDDHVHLLVRQSKTVAISDYLRELKKVSCLWMQGETPQHNFHWQSGYAAFSISPAHVAGVKMYVENQEEHHRKVSYKSELIRLLDKYGMAYDERYLWD